MLMIPVVQIYQRAFQRSAAVGTIAAVVAAMKRMFTEIRRKQGVFQNFRVKRFRMGRFQKIRQIAVTAAREIRFRDCRRIAVDTGCELQSVKISFIKVDIFRTNEIAYSQKIPAFSGCSSQLRQIPENSYALSISRISFSCATRLSWKLWAEQWFRQPLFASA